MELSRLVQVRRFIRETLNLADSAQILDFGIKSKDGVLILNANIEQQISIESLTNLAPIQTKESTTQERSKYKVHKNKKSLGPGMYTIARDFNKTAVDFAAMRNIMRTWRKDGRLRTDEVEIMASYGGKFFISMSDDERNQFLLFFNGIKKQILAGERKGTKGKTNESDN